MSVEYTVTRQSQWINEGEYVVEISAGGIDYTNPDALCKKYPGEFETFLGLVPAVEAAISIAESWKADEAKRLKPRKIFIGIGSTGGDTMPFDGISACKTNYKKLLREAKKHDEQLPKCDRCGEVLPAKAVTLTEFDFKFCDEQCAERWYEDEMVEQARFEEELTDDTD